MKYNELKTGYVIKYKLWKKVAEDSDELKLVFMETKPLSKKAMNVRLEQMTDDMNYEEMTVITVKYLDRTEA